MIINSIAITGNAVFDYFFTIIFVMCLVSIGPSMLFKLFRG